MTLYLQALTRAYMLAPEYSRAESRLERIWARQCRREGVTWEQAEEWERTTREGAENERMK